MNKKWIFFIFNLLFMAVSSAFVFAGNDTTIVNRYYGECFEVGDSVITYSGTFKFKKSGSSSDYNVYVVIFEPINPSSQSCEIQIAGDTLLQTTNDTVINLSAVGDSMDFYKWYALDIKNEGNLIGNKDSQSIKINVHVKDTAVYILQTMKEEVDNLVYNGDFEEGNKGFWTEYSYTTEAKVDGSYSYGLGPEGRYAVGANPYYYHQNFCDYSGSKYGKMLIANGNQGTDKVVYAATFDVEPNQNYIVSFEASTVSNSKADELPQLQFSVSGEKLGEVFKTNSTQCTWLEYYQIWNSGSNTTATITILNNCTTASGNDFTIDNITYRKMCTSYDTITIINNKILYDTIDVTICANESYNFNGKVLTQGGQYTEKLVTSQGLDSLITLNLTVKPTYDIRLDTTICESSFVEFNNQKIYEQGTYKAELKSQDGCDSVVFLSVNVVNVLEVSIEEEIYSWQDYFFDGNKMTMSGEYVAYYKTESGCDSIVTLNLKVNDKIYINDILCLGEEYIFGGNVLTQTGIYYDTLQAANGNDSIVVLSLTVNPTYTDTIEASIEEGGEYNRNGFLETQDGTYIHENKTIYGCDSSVVLILSVIKGIEIWVPNAFTPKDDYNREFFINISDEDVRLESFKIYNRWGTLLFETSDTKKGWNGKYKGKLCKEDVYIYDIIYYKKGIKGKTYRKTGEFLLLD